MILGRPGDYAAADRVLVSLEQDCRKMVAFTKDNHPLAMKLKARLYPGR